MKPSSLKPKSQFSSVGTISAMPIALGLIDRVGRRTLLLVGSVGLAICLGAIAAIFAAQVYQRTVLVFLIGYVAFFAFSQGAVIWVYLSEIFPGRVRAQGQSLGCSTHWIMDALISGFFPLLAARSASGPFVVFLLMMLLQFLAVWLFFPETRGVPLEDLQRQMEVSGTAASSATPATPRPIPTHSSHRS